MRQALRLTARRTWRFFETFVTAEDHALPPDNFQEDPKPVIAHRTSPTNMGLYLLSVIAARDFGWLGTHDAVDRLEATLGTMKGLERYRGHFYNWYDTRELRPLEPKYISAVDSGNLAGHLIALRSACREMMNGPTSSRSEWLSGIDDALQLTRESLRLLADDRRSHTVTRKHLEDALDALSAVLRYLRKGNGDATPSRPERCMPTRLLILQKLSARNGTTPAARKCWLGQSLCRRQSRVIGAMKLCGRSGCRGSRCAQDAPRSADRTRAGQCSTRWTSLCSSTPIASSSRLDTE